MIHSAQPYPPEPATLRSDARPNILIVDDRRENLLATEKVLRNLDADIFKANSGNEALSLMLRHRFAVALLDVQMPEMDGFELAMLMRENDGMRNIPIIFVTAISKEEKYASQAAEIGAVDYIFKPINPEILRSKVKVYLDIYSQHEQILRLNEVLRQSNEEMERFAYICSHDLQEPVRVINSYADMIQAKYAQQLDAKGQSYFSFIISHARHMRKMISDILTFSRVGREEIPIETVDCNQLTKEILLEFESLIADKNIVIICEPLPVLECSPTLLRVLFQNLIGNALKFHDGTRVPEVHIQCEQFATHWQFCVQDNGIGIDAKFYEKVFAVFQRIHPRGDYPGTGIGLSTCKKFIELCGGTIWFKSVLGKGTAFFFTLPLEPRQKMPKVA